MNKEPKGPPRFLFLELLDPDINGLLYGLRREFGEKTFDTNIHITVRGPYEDSITREEISRCQNIMANDVILIHGIGEFETNNGAVVFIKVHSENLEKIWWKPDYPIKMYGFNPHITLFKGKDLKLAKVIKEFLVKENIKLVCEEFRLTPYASKQNELFPFDNVPIEKHFFKLTTKRLVKTNILQKASNVVRLYKSKASGI